MSTSLKIVIILFLLSVFAGAVTGNSLYYRLSYLWGILIFGSWAMSVMALRGIHVVRRARTLRSQVGQVFEERYEVYNSGRFPRLWIEVRDESLLPGSYGSHVMTMIRGKESHSYLSRARLKNRGVFTLGPTIIASGDLFGMFPVKRKLPTNNSLLVYPMMVEIDRFPNPPGLLPGGESLRRRTQTITSNAAGVREYAPGDPLNRIHWLSSARRDTLIVKEFELDPLADVWIFVDADHSVQYSEKQTETEFEPQDVWRKRFIFHLPPDTLEYSVTSAASLARYYLSKRRAVGLASAGPILRVIPADRGGRQLGKILESLALIQPEGKMHLRALVEVQARHFPRGSTVVLISPNPSDQIYKSADLLLRRGMRPVLILINGTSFGGRIAPDELINKLKVLGVPYCQVEKDADLSAVLSNAVNMPTLNLI